MLSGTGASKIDVDRHNLYSLITIAVIMLPNIIYAAKCKDDVETKQRA